MHFCLKMPEILTHIFSYILDSPRAPYPGSKKGAATLAHLARTCTAFREPALDLLWYFQPSFFNMIRLLLPARNAVMFDHHRPCLARDLQPTDYARIRYYSSRIVSLGSLDSDYLSPFLPSILWSRKPISLGPLFPRLRHLDISMYHFLALASYPRLVVGPSLHKIILRLDDGQFNNEDENVDYPWDNVASVLKVRSAGISEFRVVVYSSRHASSIFLGPPPEIMQLYHCFQALELLETPWIGVTHDALTHLATLPKLWKLKISLDVAEATLFNSALPSETHAFPSLLQLSLSTEELHSCSELLKHSGFQQLQSLEITREVEGGYWDLDPFFRTLRDRLSHSVFDEVIFCKADLDRWSPPQGNISPITLNTLTPLFSFPNLSVLKSELDTTVELDDAAIRKVAEAWPHLRVFRLFERTTGGIPGITAGGLLPLIASCPKLEQLTLRINALTIPNFTQLGEVIPARNLSRLNVCTSSIYQWAQVASFLVVVFPVLSFLGFGWHYGSIEGMNAIQGLDHTELGYLADWETVHQLLSPVMASHSPQIDRRDFT